MTIDIFIRIAHIQIIISGLVVLMSALYFKRRSMESKLMGVTFLFIPISVLAMAILPLKGKDVNIPQSIDTILYFLVLSATYNFTLNGRYKKFILAVVILFTTFAIGNLLFGQKNEINTYSMVAGSFVLTGYCIFYYYRLLVDMPVQHLQRVPMFWFNAAILIFNAGTFFLFLFTPYLVEVLNNDLLIYWTFHNILNIVQHLVIMVGLWQDLRNIKLRSSSLSVL